jgi:tetratricopeptide (TPR) repeat protein
VVASRAAIKLRPNWAEAHYNLGQTFDSMGDLGKAVVCYENAVAYNSEWEDAIHNLAAAKQELQLSNLSLPTSGVYEGDGGGGGGLISSIQSMKLSASLANQQHQRSPIEQANEGEEWDVESATSHSTVDSNHSGVHIYICNYHFLGLYLLFSYHNTNHY